MDETAFALALLLVAGGLTGCVGGDGGSASSAETTSSEPTNGSTDGSQATEDPSAGANTTEGNGDAGPYVDVSQFQGTLETSGDVEPFPGAYCVPATPCEDSFTFQLPDNATAFVIGVAWNQSETLGALAYPPNDHCEGAGPAGLLADCPDPGVDNGESPLRIEITDERANMTGEWFVDMDVESPAPAAVDWTAYVSIVSEGPLPDGYAQLEGGE